MDITINLILSKRQLIAGLVLAMIVGLSYALTAETVTLTTMFPAPSGVYKKIITTAQTLLARDGGGVGIGTTDPGIYKLNVNGDANVTGTLSANAVLNPVYAP